MSTTHEFSPPAVLSDAEEITLPDVLEVANPTTNAPAGIVVAGLNPLDAPCVFNEVAYRSVGAPIATYVTKFQVVPDTSEFVSDDWKSSFAPVMFWMTFMPTRFLSTVPPPALSNPTPMPPAAPLP